MEEKITRTTKALRSARRRVRLLEERGARMRRISRARRAVVRALAAAEKKDPGASGWV